MSRSVTSSASSAAVAGAAVEQVVDPLRDLEERGIAVDHAPAGVEADPAHVGQQRLQQLGDAAAARSRVDVPDRAAPEELPAVLHAALDLAEALAENGTEALRIHAADVDLLERAHAWRLFRSCRRRLGSRWGVQSSGVTATASATIAAIRAGSSICG
jgi:hypothetical protein